MSNLLKGLSMSQCEDYPCCGHTDGLGCDWVSPNEVVPCLVCIDARKPSPYHASVEECPTIRERAIAAAVSQKVPCEFYGDCDGEVAETKYNGAFVCLDCFDSMRKHDAEMQEQYDDEWSHRGFRSR
jgi:hypothetical protein